MMKTLVSIAVLAALCCGSSAAYSQKSIDLEPHLGYTYSCGRFTHVKSSGFEVGLSASFQVKPRFYINPEVSYVGTREYDWVVSHFIVPVYASYRLPVKKVTFDFNVGPYGQFATKRYLHDFGIAVKAGVAYERFHFSLHTYQNLIYDSNPMFFGLAFGYRIPLK